MIFNISNVLIQSSVNSFGATVVAGNTAASNIEGFVYVSMNALYQTSLSFTSQNLGARQFGRIDRILVQCLLIVAAIGLVMGNGAHLLGTQLLSIYSDEADVVAYGMERLGVVAATYFLCGMMDVVAGSVRGLGYSVLPMLVSIAGACVFRGHLDFYGVSLHSYPVYPVCILSDFVGADRERASGMLFSRAPQGAAARGGVCMKKGRAHLTGRISGV